MTPDEAVAYHRTFIPFDPKTHLCKVGCHGTKASGARILVEAPVFAPSGNGKSITGLPSFGKSEMNKVDERTDLRRRGLESPNTFEKYGALQLIGSNSKKITIVPKMAQDFTGHATDWEKAWSVLAKTGIGVFQPVVDENFTVVGHVGWVKETSLIVPEAAIILNDGLKFAIVQQPQIPILVTDRLNPKMAPPGWRFINRGRSWNDELVVVGIDGEVVAHLDGESTNGVAISVDSFLDYISLAKIAASLVGRAALSVAKGLGRSLSRFGGRLLAKLAAQKAAKKAVTLQIVRGHQKAMGIPAKHFDAIAAAAKETDMILIFRANKQAAVPWIERGSPGKPFFFKFKSDPQTGILSAKAKDEVELVYEKGYYLVADQNWALRVVTKGGKRVTETIPIKNPYWPVKPGQVLDPKFHRPVVGDYDMLGAAPMASKGSNVALAPVGGNGNWSGPHVERAAKAINDKLDQPRVLHGAQDQSLMGLSDDTAYAIFPDGQVVMMYGRAEQEAFYASIGRQTGAGSYAQPAGEVVDELAARRAKR
jgi:hypothetical protein